MVTFLHCSVPLESGALIILGFSNFSLEGQLLLTPNGKRRKRGKCKRGKGREGVVGRGKKGIKRDREKGQENIRIFT